MTTALTWLWERTLGPLHRATCGVLHVADDLRQHAPGRVWLQCQTCGRATSGWQLGSDDPSIPGSWTRPGMSVSAWIRSRRRIA